MFRSESNATLFSLRQSREDILRTTLDSYARLAKSDPVNLRNLIPCKEIWRFFVDGYKQESDGWVEFENRENGYLCALTHGFHEIFTYHDPVDSAFIKKLHALSLMNVHDTNFTRPGTGTPGNFRPDNKRCAGFELIIGEAANVSSNGLAEFFENKKPDLYINIHPLFLNKNGYFIGISLDTVSIQLIRHHFDLLKSKKTSFSLQKLLIHLYKSGYAHPSILELYNPEFAYSTEYDLDLIKNELRKLLRTIGKTNSIESVVQAITDSIEHDRHIIAMFTSLQAETTQARLEQKMNTLIANYYEGISAQTNRMNKLHVIIKFIQGCEQLHPFSDGNCRTFCMLLLNHLLIRNGFPLAILENPNRFDCFSHAELLSDVLAGMRNTFELIAQQSLFGVATSKTNNPDDALNTAISIEEANRLAKPHHQSSKSFE